MQRRKARALLKRITPMINLAGKSVKWGGLERKAVITKLYALMRRYGPASCFLTVAPDDVQGR